MSHHSVLSWDLYVGVPLETQQSVSNIANAHNSRNKQTNKPTSQYVLVTWVERVVTSSSKCCLPMIVLGTRLKESTCWRLTNQEFRNGLWLAFGQTESRLPTNPNGCHMTSSISQVYVVIFAPKLSVHQLHTSWPHSRKMKGILFPELPMMIFSGKALHSYPSMSIFKITHFASIVAWGEKFYEFEMRRANIG